MTMNTISKFGNIGGSVYLISCAFKYNNKDKLKMIAIAIAAAAESILSVLGLRKDKDGKLHFSILSRSEELELEEVRLGPTITYTTVAACVLMGAMPNKVFSFDKFSGYENYALYAQAGILLSRELYLNGDDSSTNENEIV